MVTNVLNVLSTLEYTDDNDCRSLACVHLSSSSYCESSGNYNSDSCIPYGCVWNFATDSEHTGYKYF